MRKLTAIQGQQVGEFGVLRAIHAGSRQFDLRVGIKGGGDGYPIFDQGFGLFWFCLAINGAFGASPKCIERASVAKFVPTYSEFCSTCARISAMACSAADFSVGNVGAAGAFSLGGAHAGAMIALLTLVEPQTAQDTMPLSANLS